MEHICPKCNVSMKVAALDYPGLIRIFKDGEEGKIKKSILDFSNPSHMSQIDQYVCPKCGYIEFYAKEPDKFK